MTVVYDTSTLAGVMAERVDRPSTFLLDLFFPFVQNFDTEEIFFDVLVTGRKLAPFVHPDASARPGTSGGYKSKTFKPANVKLIEPVKPSRALKRRAGEALGGSLSPAERLDAIMVDILAEQEKTILRRLEWMAASALRNGTVVVSGEDYASQTVDFGRAAGHSVALAGAARWGEAVVKPLDDIETWASLVQDACGIAPNVVVLGTEAWKLLRKDADFMKILDIRRQASGIFEVGPISVNDVSRARYVGMIGDLEFWVYRQVYEADNGDAAEFIDKFDVILGSTAIEGIRASGAILDVTSLVPVDVFRKVYDVENPSRRMCYSEAAPLIIPSRPNASFRAKVR